MSSTITPSPSITDLITQDHEQIRSLFSDYSTSTSTAQKYSIMQDVVSMLTRHETAEEEILYPRLQEEFPSLYETTSDLTDQESGVKPLLAKMEGTSADDSDFISLADQIISEVSSHAAQEEKTILPVVDENFSPEQLSSLGEAFESVKLNTSGSPREKGWGGLVDKLTSKIT